MTLVLVADYYTRRISQPIQAWCDRHGLEVRHYEQKLISVARNWAIKKIALPSRHDWFVWFDEDMEPGAGADLLLNPVADVLHCHPAFHAGAFACSRRVLQGTSPPWFSFELTIDGTEIIGGCSCRSFEKTARAAGFTFAQGGRCRQLQHRVEFY